ncbi:glycosyl transferase [Plantibacter flavus]|uniref:glycosyltransferase n=1 Tax=Plantibacter flavus TaxID=150123 RepID=UPI0010C16DC7|nr:glycosyltransferase [Plantibacter flavus]TKJ96928.1 glycosyl transferase [Plantibacter flavus]
MAGLIIHEWIERHGGSENVVDEMAAAFPDADIHCLWNNAPDRYPGRSVTESWLARTPLRKSKAAALPFMPATWAATRVSKADFVLISSHAFAHHAGGRQTPDGPERFVYVHTPARYLWAPELDVRGGNVIARAVAPSLRRIDRKRAQDGATFAANSDYIRLRMERSWGVEAEVIHPPVRVEYLQSVPSWADRLSAEDAYLFSTLPSEYVLGASRFVDYKRLDVAIRAGELAGLPVVLAGAGPQHAELQALADAATVPVIIMTRPSDELLFALYQAASLLVFAAVEDFGIMPVEAMALGTPVLVVAEGGASESVLALNGGVVVTSLDDASLRNGVTKALSVDMAPAQAAAGAEFGLETFRARLISWVTSSSVRT